MRLMWVLAVASLR